MHQGDLSLACAWALLDGLAGGGVRDVCVSPGSRSTPLAVAAARHPGLTVHVHLDERSGAFFATGLAHASHRPVAIVCTSGTATAELLPGVVEASQSRAPLLLLTADRPPRYRGTGANQTIDQVGLYGRYVRTTLDLAVPEADGQEAWWRQAAREAVAAARSDPPGPVHVNCPFEEPLSPTPDAELPAPSGERLDAPGREDAQLTEDEADRLAALVSEAEGLLVAGPWPGELAEEAALWVERLGWPVLAEPTSSLRLPGASLAAGQALIGDRAWVGANAPGVVVQVGATPTTRATRALVASAPEVLVADRRHPDPDPDRHASWRIAVDADALRRALEGRAGVASAPAAWTDTWREGDLRARRALDGFLDGVDEPFEPRVARDVARAIPPGGTLFVGNSSPIRDLDLAMEPRTGLRVMANRGASGIDGLVSSALGVAAARSGPTVGLLGDLSFLYDVGGLVWAGRTDPDLVLVVVRNGGGEIFSLLPQRALPEHEDLFVTPHEVDLEALCGAAGVTYVRVERGAGLTPAVSTAVAAGGLTVVETVVDPARGLALRTGLDDAIAVALHATDR